MVHAELLNDFTNDRYLDANAYLNNLQGTQVIVPGEHEQQAAFVFVPVALKKAPYEAPIADNLLRDHGPPVFAWNERDKISEDAFGPEDGSEPARAALTETQPPETMAIRRAVRFTNINGQKNFHTTEVKCLGESCQSVTRDVIPLPIQRTHAQSAWHRRCGGNSTLIWDGIDRFAQNIANKARSLVSAAPVLSHQPFSQNLDEGSSREYTYTNIDGQERLTEIKMDCHDGLCSIKRRHFNPAADADDAHEVRHSLLEPAVQPEMPQMILPELKQAASVTALPFLFAMSASI
jgi:hypothetical protein